jgi:hypothetical protein
VDDDEVEIGPRPTTAAAFAFSAVAIGPRPMVVVAFTFYSAVHSLYVMPLTLDTL